MSIEELIKSNKEEYLKEIRFLVNYHVLSSWWAPYFTWNWTQDIIAHYYFCKSLRKWKKYKLFKLLQDVKEEDFIGI